MQKRNRSRIIYLVASILALLVLALAVIYPRARQQWMTPLGPGLQLPTYTPAIESISPTVAAAALTPTGSSAAASVVPTSTTPPLTPTPQPLCGGPPVMVVLGIGADADDYDYGLADVIRIARIDFTIPKVSVLSIPRDLWVQIPDINTKYDITAGKLNQAYFYGGPGMGYYTGPGAGAGLLARTLDLNFGMRVDHYGAVNMNTFVKIIDALGGIDVYLEKPVDGRSEDPSTIDLGFFPVGQHHFSGEEALRFSRVRKLYNDFTRQDNQTLVLCALRKKITEPATLIKLPKIIAAFQNAVLTDLTPEQLTQLACLAPQLTRQNILFTRLPDELFSPGRVLDPRRDRTTFVLEADYDQIQTYVKSFLSGEWPTEPKEPTCP